MNGQRDDACCSSEKKPNKQHLKFIYRMIQKILMSFRAFRLLSYMSSFSLLLSAALFAPHMASALPQAVVPPAASSSLLEVLSPSAVATTTPYNVYSSMVPSSSFLHSMFGYGGMFLLLSFVGLAMVAVASYRKKTPKRAGTIKLYLYVMGIAGGLLLCLGYYFGTDAERIPLVFSNRTMSASVWESYQQEFIEQSSSRTIDPARLGDTTSEGESYTMLRAVWLDDQKTFDSSWQWTMANLSRPSDHLFSWLYGKKLDGSYGVLTIQGGNNTASDADSDIALSLVFAYSRWQRPEYLIAAKNIISDIWSKEVVTVNGIPYLAADDLEKKSTQGTYVINPSYFSPYAYRIFAKVDPNEDGSVEVPEVLRPYMGGTTQSARGPGRP